MNAPPLFTIAERRILLELLDAERREVADLMNRFGPDERLDARMLAITRAAAKVKADALNPVGA